MVVQMAKNARDIVVGFISQQHICCSFIHFSPGINLNTNGDMLGQKYRTPQQAIEEDHVDCLIVGRGIYSSQDPLSELSKYIYTFRDSLINEMKQLNIVKTGTFTLKSGKQTNTYVDCRLLMQDPYVMNDVASELSILIESKLIQLGYKTTIASYEEPDSYVIAGVPTGAVPLATMVSFNLSRPMIMIREKPKEYGTGNVIEGATNIPSPDAPIDCVLIEDVLTTGISVIGTIRKLRENNYNVILVVGIIDREMGAIDAITTCNTDIDIFTPTWTLFKLSDFVK
jgi:orotate phosphoribosyltransferase